MPWVEEGWNQQSRHVRAGEGSRGDRDVKTHEDRRPISQQGVPPV